VSLLQNALLRHPRIYNVLHALGVVPLYTMTGASELDCVARHAKGACRAVEIGTFTGASAAAIAASLDPSGKLYCIDPYLDGDALRAICLRHLGRKQLLDRIVMIRRLSSKLVDEIPAVVDFMFIDGDHSWRGIETDWAIVMKHLRPGGVACFHDTNAHREKLYICHDSIRFFEEVIQVDKNFEHIASVDTLNVIRRIK
jgi:predicted O-methyltransferase YrrM